MYFADPTHHVVRKVDETGVITTVVGSGEKGYSPDGTMATEAKLSQPSGLAVTADGVVYVSDSGNNCVRRVAADGRLETVAGIRTPGDSGDGGPATDAAFNEPHGLWLYGDNVLLVSDFYNSRIRAVKLEPR